LKQTLKTKNYEPRKFEYCRVKYSRNDVHRRWWIDKPHKRIYKRIFINVKNIEKMENLQELNLVELQSIEGGCKVCYAAGAAARAVVEWLLS
jgi:hypothetical protein